jgi:hypothetical protein
MYNTAQHSITQLNVHNTAQDNTTQYSAVQHSTTDFRTKKTLLFEMAAALFWTLQTPKTCF